MLYFDWLSHKHFGNVRSQIWAFLHFPFHLSLVLFMEAIAQFVIWQKLGEVVDIINFALGECWDASRLDINPNQSLVDNLNMTFLNFVDTYPPKYEWTYNEIDMVLENIVNSPPEASWNSDLNHFSTLILNSLYTTYGIVAPKDKSGTHDVEAEFDKQIRVFVLVVCPLSFLHPHPLKP